MSVGPSKQDRELLSRLNALKRSTVDLNEKQFKVETSNSTPQSSLDPLVGRVLHADISARFRALSGNHNGLPPSSAVKGKSGTSLDVPGWQDEDNDRTVEELLAELGSEEEWAIGRSEEDEVAVLLGEAKAALRERPQDVVKDAEQQDEGYMGGATSDEQRRVGKDTTGMSDIDLSVFQPEPDSDPDDPYDHQPQSKDELKQSLDQEVDDYLARIMDEIQHERPQQPPHGDKADDDPPPEYRSETENDINVPQPSAAPRPSTPLTSSTQPLDLPSPSSKTPISKSKPQPHDPPDDATDPLTFRFASLSFSLPSVPTTLPKTLVLPSSPSNHPEDPTSAADAEVETWCIICLADATLQCVGCDGDLYCAQCWMEGHRGEAAGSEERRHRALQYVKGGKKGKEKQKEKGRWVERFEGV